jgi:hypothetical protein
MFGKILFCALASAAMIPAAAIAQHGPGGGGGPPGGMGGPGNAGGFGMGGPGGMGAMGGMGMGRGMDNGGLGGIGMGSSMRDQGRLNSQGPANASATGIAHANQNSVLAGTTATTTVTSGPLAGLTTGTTLLSNGTAVGTVQQIRTTGRGTVAVVIVKGTNGGFYAVPANKLAYSGGTLSTTARLAGINSSTAMTGSTTGTSQASLYSQGPMHASATGIAHANQHSVLYGATATSSANGRGRVNSQGALHASATGIGHANQHSVLYNGSSTPLTGVSVGMSVLSNGTQVGTVYRVVTANGVITRVLVQGTNGRIYSLSPSALTAAGGSVTTTATLRGI